MARFLAEMGGKEKGKIDMNDNIPPLTPDIKSEGALVLFSGGQDSTACLAWALDRYERVETIGFDYGQNHNVELQCRKEILSDISEKFPQWSDRLGPDHLLELPTLARLSDTALTRDVEIEMSENGLPNTFVPGRNLLFFTYAAALGYRRGLPILVGGMCETDFSGYPDCRNATLLALEEAIRLGTDMDFQIETPLMWLSKEKTWELADQLGGAELITLTKDKTHTCYKGDHKTKHEWGYGCATCPACELRAKGYEKWQNGL